MKFACIVIVILSQFAFAQNAPNGLRQMETLQGVYRADVSYPGVPQGYGQNSASYLTFFRDGLVMRVAPGEGLQGWDDAFWMNQDIRAGDPAHKGRWGIYVLASGQRELMFTNRETLSIDITGYPQSIQVQGQRYVLLNSGSGLQLQGTYKSVKDDSVISFTPDGRMNQQGIVANCISGGQHFSYGGGVPSMNSGGSLCLDRPLPGSYTIGYYTLQLAFSNSSQKFSFWTDPGQVGSTPQNIYIGGTQYQLVR